MMKLGFTSKRVVARSMSASALNDTRSLSLSARATPGVTKGIRLTSAAFSDVMAIESLTLVGIFLEAGLLVGEFDVTVLSHVKQVKNINGSHQHV